MTPETNEPKMAKYLGWWIPITDWIPYIATDDIAILQRIACGLQAHGVGAAVATDKGYYCVYREILPDDLDGSGEYFHEWALGIRRTGVITPDKAQYVRHYGPRKTG